jgi:hypothetical protein
MARQIDGKGTKETRLSRLTVQASLHRISMLRLRLNLVKLLLQLVVFSLPTLAFVTAGYIRFHADIFRDNSDQIDLRAYFVLLIVATLSWVLVSWRANLSMPQLFFAAAGKTKKIVTACATTYVITLVATFF